MCRHDAHMSCLGVVSAACTSRTDKAIGPPLGKEGFSALLFGTITTEEVLHTQTTRPSDSTHVLIMWRGYDTCGSPSSYAGYADNASMRPNNCTAADTEPAPSRDGRFRTKDAQIVEVCWREYRVRQRPWVPGAGLEPARPFEQRLLRPPCLPFHHPG